MKKHFTRIILIFTLLLTASYSYAWLRLANGWVSSLALAIPFLFAWLLPFHFLPVLSYLAIGVINFLIVSIFFADLLLLITSMDFIKTNYGAIVLSMTAASLLVGTLRAFKGPNIRQVSLVFPHLPEALKGLKIVQISDLHVGPTLGKKYVERVVNKTLAQNPDLVVLTGDIVDGKISLFEDDARPLEELAKKARCYFILGNHDYYAGPDEWIQFFKDIGMTVLINRHDIVSINGTNLMVAGVTDPAASMLGHPSPNPQEAMSSHYLGETMGAAFKILLAHNPKLAIRGSEAGFDCMLSGHTHGGQFFPWTYIVKKVHSPHYWGESNEGRMRVYVSAGTGTWGPPLRLGTTTEISVITIR